MEKRQKAMSQAIEEVESALKTLGKGSPWSADIKASDDFLVPLFESYFGKLGLPNLMAKKNFYELAEHVPDSEIDSEINEKTRRDRAGRGECDPCGRLGLLLKFAVLPTSGPANHSDIQHIFSIPREFAVLFFAKISDIQALLFGRSESSEVIAIGLAIGYSIKPLRVVYDRSKEGDRHD